MHPCIPLIFCVLALLLPAACSSTPARKETTLPNPIKNLHLLAPGLYSGDEPATAAHYDQLAALGIKTVISVDAIAPDPDLADRHNIRIVHLPIGYDGIDNSRATELAAAIAQLDHPIYLHCHHGKHRGPAAIGVGAIGAGIITNDQAIEFMTDVGTSSNYPGLYAAARNAKPLEKETLNAVHDFPARAPVSSFGKSMGKLDRLHDRLWDIAEDDWQTPEDHPDLSPTAVSGQIHDLMRSMLDLDFLNNEGIAMRPEMIASMKAAGDIETKITIGDFPAAMTALDALNNLCIDCHDQHRD